MHGEGGCAWQRGHAWQRGGMRGMHGQSLHGRYASYWNAFLCELFNQMLLVPSVLTVDRSMFSQLFEIYVTNF